MRKASGPIRGLVCATAAAALATLGFAGCAGTNDAAGAGVDDRTQTLRVAAAASLQRAFDEIANDFEAAHPGIQIAPITYDGSSTLATQIVEGAPVDVFASADERNMRIVVEAGLAKAPATFATNTLVIAVPAGNPAGVETLRDLPRVTTVLCAPEVPCGAAAETLLENAGVSVAPSSLEQNVTAVLQKVAAGEADAGLVYRTDVSGDDRVDSMVPEGSADAPNPYPIAAIQSSKQTDSKQTDAAQAFVNFVLGPDGQRVLREHGFGKGDSS